MKLPESIPLIREVETVSSTAGNGMSAAIFLALTILVVALLATWWRSHKGMRRSNNDGANPSNFWARLKTRNSGIGVKIVGAAHLSTKHYLYEVEWRGKTLLIGCSPDSMQMLAECSPAASNKSGDQI
jgi:hypothetical protein